MSMQSLYEKQHNTLQASFKESDRYKEKRESLDRDMLITFVGSEFDFLFFYMSFFLSLKVIQ